MEHSQKPHWDSKYDDDPEFVDTQPETDDDTGEDSFLESLANAYEDIVDRLDLIMEHLHVPLPPPYEDAVLPLSNSSNSVPGTKPSKKRKFSDK